MLLWDYEMGSERERLEGVPSDRRLSLALQVLDHAIGVMGQIAPARVATAIAKGFELVRCEFNGCGLAQYDDPAMSLRVTETRLEGCVVKRCAAHGVVFEDVRLTT